MWFEQGTLTYSCPETTRPVRTGILADTAASVGDTVLVGKSQTNMVPRAATNRNAVAIRMGELSYTIRDATAPPRSVMNERRRIIRSPRPARSRIDGGIASPSVVAVLRFTTCLLYTSDAADE